MILSDFGGGASTSDVGALLLGAIDRAIRLVDRFAACFSDGRMPGRVRHAVATLVGQRVFGIALGYEDLVDHDDLRRGPALGAALRRIEARRPGLAPLAGKSTLNRLEHAPTGSDRYRRIGHDPAAIEALFVEFSSMPTRHRPRASRSISISISAPLTIRSTGDRRGGSSTAITTATATYRSTSSAATTRWPRRCGAPTSTPVLGLPRRSPALLPRSEPAGRG